MTVRNNTVNCCVTYLQLSIVFAPTPKMGKTNNTKKRTVSKRQTKVLKKKREDAFKRSKWAKNKKEERLRKKRRDDSSR